MAICTHPYVYSLQYGASAANNSTRTDRDLLPHDTSRVTTHACMSLGLRPKPPH